MHSQMFQTQDKLVGNLIPEQLVHFAAIFTQCAFG